MQQLTKEQAIAFYELNEWQSWTDEQIVRMQLFQDYLAVPFGRFHEALSKVLARPVWTHEFAFADALREEYLGTKPSPTLSEIMDLIPTDKRILLRL